MKLHGITTKYILRRATDGVLPKEILTRKKMGFPVPIGRWLRGEFSQVVDDYVLGERARKRGIFDENFVGELVAQHRAGEDHSERLWALINFEIWKRRFFDCEEQTDRLWNQNQQQTRTECEYSGSRASSYTR
jgi:asparagine synthase (glutamine-hydrolysing)